MRSKTTFLLLLAALVAVGCGGTENTNTPTANANTNTTSPSANNALGTTKAPEAATTNDAPTLGPVINAYYDALRKGDAAGARKVMERDFLKDIEADMKEEKKTDLVAFLLEADKLPTPKMEARNEQITGNTGVAEIKGGSYGTWTKFTFIKEDGVWKVSNKVASLGGK